MATAEQKPPTMERIGRGAEGLGLIGGVIWFIGELAGINAVDKLLFPSAGLIVTGEILKRISRGRKGNQA